LRGFSYLTRLNHCMIRWILTLIGAITWFICPAQNKSIQNSDSVHILDQVIVKGYASDRTLLEVPAAIGYLDAKKLERFNNTSILPAVNTIPGVRMEERSPGSYRFAIRGSSLRSPFGVRNVKMYWNGLPLTDGGGNTYLNLIDFNAIGSVEVIKGPGSSLYGAGTGGVVLLNSPSVKERQVQFSSSVGSYGLQRYQFAAQTGTEKTKIRIQFAHQQADGYRIDSKLRKDAINTDMTFAINQKGILSGTVFYTDLYYGTPGGLTKTEYDANPAQARPDTKSSPGSVTQHAAVYNKTVFTGWTYEYEWNNHWSNRTGIYGSRTQFVNPAIRNYEDRTENNWGGRTETYYKVSEDQWKGKLTFGGEFQFFESPVSDYGNRGGVKDTLQVSDKLNSSQSVLFAQTEIDLPRDFFLTLGGSTTFLQYRFIRISDPQPVQQTRNFTPVFSPRIALLKKISQLFSIYGSISQGFSTPSLAEVRPSTNTYNNTLNPETGTNYEVGFRGSLFNQKITVDVTGYYFHLANTIVDRFTPDGADYYVNAGKTSQPGLEMAIGWVPIFQGNGFISNFKLWFNYTYNPYTFRNYYVGTDNFSGNKLTGVARDIIVSGLDITFKPRFYGNITFTHTGALPLNDANTLSSSAYYLMGARVGYKLPMIGKFLSEIFGGVDNAFNTKYSLGNDLNAAPGNNINPLVNRYFNAASPRNFYVSLKVAL
jgi:iron complex outermembrane receptor protein